MDRRWSLVSALGLGAGLMYLLDPDRGNRRRALVRDKAVRACNVTSAAMGKTSRDVSNRARGLLAEARSRLTREEVTDVVLVERARAKIGRVVSHPRSIEVTANQGRVTLAGPIPAREVDGLLATVAAVRGVTGVENRLQVHQRAGDVPGLQGETPRPEPRVDLMQRNWAPATRLLVGAAGAGLAAYGVSRRNLAGATLSTVGVGLLTRAATNLEMERLVGTGSGRRGIDITKTINVDAPVEWVFEFWSKYENFPRWMSHVREVRDTGDGRSHWVVDGPAGVPVGFDAELTQFLPNQTMAWKSVSGAVIRNAGVIHFEPNPDSTTRINIKFTYNPPAGAVGHAVASLFGADPKRLMDDDLARMKTLIETGNPPRDAAEKSGPESEAFIR